MDDIVVEELLERIKTQSLIEDKAHEELRRLIRKANMHGVPIKRVAAAWGKTEAAVRLHLKRDPDSVYTPRLYRRRDG